MALHAALWCWCAWRALSVGALPLFAVVVAVAIDGMFGYSLRQPVYWLLFTMVLLLAETRAAPAAQRDGSAALARATGLRRTQAEASAAYDDMARVVFSPSLYPPVGSVPVI